MSDRTVSRRVWIAVLALACIAALAWLALDRPEPPAARRRADASPPRTVARFRALPRIELSATTASTEASATAGLLTGVVRSSQSGAGIEGAQLHFAHAGQVTAVATDGAGRFAFRPSEPGIHDLLFVAADGYWPLDAGPIGHLARFTARAGEQLDGAAIELDPIRPVAVTVVDPSGRAVAAAQVSVDGEVAPGAASTGQTDGDGELEVRARPGAVVRAAKDEVGAGIAILDEDAARHGELEVELATAAAPRPAGRISGTVLGPDGTPAPFALVVARSRANAARVVQVAADEAGAFRFADLRPGSYDLVASLEGLAPARADEVPTGTRDLELSLARGGDLAGTVASESGAPVVAFTVVAWPRQGALERGAAHAESFFDAAGRYALRHLRPGSYAVKVYAGGWAPSEERTVEIPPESVQPARADFVLGRGGRVFGRVIERDSGQALAGATVSVEQALGTIGVSRRIFATATTGGDGSFELRGVPPGRQSLLAQAPGHDGRIVSGLDVSADESVGPVTVALRATPEGRESRLQYTGIGAVLAAEGDALVIREVVAGGGAEAAGLGVGDAIVAVDGAAVTELGFEGAIHHIRGPVGSVVKLSLRRGGAVMEVDVERRAMN